LLGDRGRFTPRPPGTVFSIAGQRDAAVVLSGGGMNGMLLETGFLKRLRETALWDRVGWFFGTSAGALAGWTAALDRLDDLERFLLRLQVEETFRSTRLWQLPLLGTHEYVLPQTITERLGEPAQLARDLASADRELVVVATDVSPGEPEETGPRAFELVYSSRETPPEVMAQAVLASAAISALVLPVPVGDRIATDGGWVRNFPLTHVYERPEVQRIVAFRYVPQYPPLGAEPLQAAAARLRRVSRVPPARAVVAELEEAVEREGRGEPAHLGDMIMRLSRVAIGRNTVLEEHTAEERDSSIRELRSLREDVLELLRAADLPEAERKRLAGAVDERFAAARFPFRHDREIPRITVTGSAGQVNLGAGFRKQQPWTVAAKKQLIQHGYELTDAELRRHGVD
jgi:predicted acylesterase/phospholipase RssA